MKKKKIQYLGRGRTLKKWKFYFENLWNETFCGRGCGIVLLGGRFFIDDVGFCLLNFAFGVKKE